MRIIYYQDGNNNKRKICEVILFYIEKIWELII